MIPPQCDCLLPGEHLAGLSLRTAAVTSPLLCVCIHARLSFRRVFFTDRLACQCSHTDPPPFYLAIVLVDRNFISCGLTNVSAMKRCHGNRQRRRCCIDGQQCPSRAALARPQQLLIAARYARPSSQSKRWALYSTVVLLFVTS